jgi:hypothetical protein
MSNSICAGSGASTACGTPPGIRTIVPGVACRVCLDREIHSSCQDHYQRVETARVFRQFLSGIECEERQVAARGAGEQRGWRCRRR